MTYEWWIGCLADEFHLAPTQVIRELAVLPVGFLEQIMEYRQYAQTKAAYDRARTQSEIPDTPLTDLVREIDFDLAQEGANDGGRADGDG